MSAAVSPAERRAVARIASRILLASVETYRLQDARECRECGHRVVESELFTCVLGSGPNHAPMGCQGFVTGAA